MLVDLKRFIHSAANQHLSRYAPTGDCVTTTIGHKCGLLDYPVRDLQTELHRVATGAGNPSLRVRIGDHT